MLQAVGLRLLSDEVVTAANSQGLKLDASFDDAHTDFVMFEATGAPTAIEQMEHEIIRMGYHRLGDEVPTKEYDQASSGAPPQVPLDNLPDPMTDAEAAKFMRRSPQTVQHMRLHGGLPYSPGRPPTISKADILEYLERTKIRGSVEPSKPIAAQKKERDPEAMIEDVRAYALKMKLRPARKPRGKSAG